MKETLLQALAKLERREVITTDVSVKDECCGVPRDEDGFCKHRDYHPIYVGIQEES